jgi:hypothetical protein
VGLTSLIVALSVSCKPDKAAQSAPRYQAWSERAAEPVDAVQELTTLPPGLALKGGRVTVAQNFPTASAPHKILGVYQFPFDRRQDDTATRANASLRQELRASAKKLVAERGGNAYVITDFDIWVLHVSSATPDAQFYPDAQSALDKHHAKPPGTTQVAKVTRSLDAWTSMPVNFEKGGCYHVTFALGANARVERKLVGSITGVEVRSLVPASGAAKGPRPSTALTLGADGPGLERRAYGIFIGCAGVNLAGQVDWTLPSGPLGSGDVEVAVWKQTPSRESIRVACTACASTDERRMDACLAKEQLSSSICTP